MKNFTPDQVRGMSVAEITAAIDGFQEFNGAGDNADDVPTWDEIEEAMRLSPDT